ncbi:unnamed protein product [Schistocephalus solidus]|uniref:TIR domain-containing protein n=1 Tax=Schistocephalus solidus TaxID=70667 RepID=A0A183TI39_SCHSO|nr:unnamed protein product [Schistocephalus solidus]
MLSLQYQAVPGVLEMIRKLNQACIRFVHFSQENQLRSRVFAERLGLEADWNCHISLASEPRYQRKPRSVYQIADLAHGETLQDGELTVENPKMSVILEGAPIEIHLSRPSDSPGATSVDDHVSPASKSTSSNSSLSSADATTITAAAAAAMSTSTISSSSSADEVPCPPTDTSAYNYVFSNKPAGRESCLGCDRLEEPSYEESQVRVGYQLEAAPGAFTTCSRQIERSNAIYVMLPLTNAPYTPVSNEVVRTHCDDIARISPAIQERRLRLFERVLHRPSQELSSTVLDRRCCSTAGVGEESRLPCGIKNIRWHLKNVDNVPLKVSLFTECTPPAVSEMIDIMQEYGETVCVVGSCLSMANIELFFRGDTSIAFFPVLPLVCGHDPWTAQNGRLTSTSGPVTSSQTDEMGNCEGDTGQFSSLAASTAGSDSSQPLMRRWRRPRQRKFGSILPPARDSFDLEELRSSKQQSEPNQCPLGGNQCPPSKLLDVAGQLIALGAPLVGRLDGTQFDLLQLITEAHASVNNIYLCLTFAITASATTGMFYLLCFSVWPSMPFFMLDSVVSPVSAALDSRAVLAQPSTSLLERFAWLPPVFVGSVWPLAYVPASSSKPLLTQQPVNWNELLPYSAAAVSYADQVYWLTLLVIPILSASLFGRTVDHRAPLRQPPFKKSVMLSSERCCRFALVTALRFLPSVLVCVLSGLVHLLLLCPSVGTNYACLSASVLPPTEVSPTTAWVASNATENFLSEYVRLLPSVLLVESIVFYQFVLSLGACVYLLPNILTNHI